MKKRIEELGITPYQENAFAPGHTACPGCGSTIALRQALNTVGDHAVYFVPASCASLYFGPADTVTTHVPVIHTLFAGAFGEAEGMSHALRIQGRDEKVVVWAGDGCSYDIALGGLSGVAARGANMLVFCNDNEGYQNTGGHESTATPPDASTRTGRRAGHGPEVTCRKDLAEIMASHRVPYVATACAACPEDYAAKVKKALSIEGFRMILVLSPCVTWGFESRNSVKLARLAVETGYFPLYEVEWGKRYHITYEPSMAPIERFTSLQKRVQGADLTLMRREIEDKWNELRFKCARTPGSELVPPRPWVTAFGSAQE
ncbi:MAG TPA: thiamine pyrophosphate-dependent enzyme [Armatimonadota bacterium]|nr:thiamine pyrophosphate-dependent enzyme [Armatimonadota bacterium]